jgi:hypothetical protein
MERHYHLTKIGIVAVAMAFAFFGSGVSTPRPMQPLSQHGQYTAAAELQAAAWHATVRAGRLIACLASTHFAKT